MFERLGLTVLKGLAILTAWSLNISGLPKFSNLVS